MITATDLRLRAYTIVVYTATIVMSVLAPPMTVMFLGITLNLRQLLFAPPFLMLVIIADRYGIPLLMQMIRTGYVLLLFSLGMSLIASETTELTNVLTLAIFGIALGLALSHAMTLLICLLGDRSTKDRGLRFLGAPQAALFLTYGCLVLFILPVLPPIPHLWHRIIVSFIVLVVWNLLLSILVFGAVVIAERREKSEEL